MSETIRKTSEEVNNDKSLLLTHDLSRVLVDT
jgi:hypothetical protein